MQHLDEGTIHAWLDGALTPEEAARADAHVKECAQCQTAVAEARGFIAASSRILTALDDAPRGVIPVAAPRQRVQPWIWRVAATALVVATGTVLLVKQRGSERTSASKVVDSALREAAQTTVMSAADSTVAGSAAATGIATAPPSVFRAMTPRATGLKVKAAPTRPTAKQAPALNAESPLRVGDRKVDAELRSDVAAQNAAPAPTSGRAFGAVAGASIRSESVPREVATKRMIGRTQTFYEIAPGDTVVLEEQSSTQLESIVVTGAAVGRAQPQAARQSKAAAATESQQKVEAAAAPSQPQPAAAPPPPVAALQDAASGDQHAISWLDASTGRVVILSGRHSQEELQRIREQIQRLRNAAPPKRNPD